MKRNSIFQPNFIIRLGGVYIIFHGFFILRLPCLAPPLHNPTSHRRFIQFIIIGPIYFSLQTTHHRKEIKELNFYFIKSKEFILKMAARVFIKSFLTKLKHKFQILIPNFNRWACNLEDLLLDRGSSVSIRFPEEQIPHYLNSWRSQKFLSCHMVTPS